MPDHTVTSAGRDHPLPSGPIDGTPEAGTFHLTLPPQPGRGFVVVVPGGGYMTLSRKEATPVTHWLAGQGIPCGYVGYSVAPARHPGPLRQVLSTLAALRVGEFGSVDGPIALCGFSAGGHLAGLAATSTPAEQAMADSSGVARDVRPDLAVLAYPVTTFHRRPMDRMARSLLGTAHTRLALRAMSLENRVDAQTPPFFVWHTSQDPSVPVDDSLRLAAALHEHGVPVALHVFPYGGHALGVDADPATAPLADGWMRLCLEWLAHHGV